MFFNYSTNINKKHDIKKSGVIYFQKSLRLVP